ncbi:MAG: TMEM165/GDT1 family protein [Candidatus ainarchaeum sp.]|nr:TMEM165/GDT1 family protein [Candidatus ainarchaeum sp.]
MIEGVAASFALAFFAELGDKTQLAVLALSTRHRNRGMVFAGAFCGLSLAVAVSVAFGGIASQVVPLGALKVAAGLGLVAFGLHAFFSREKGEGERAEAAPGSIFFASLASLFVMEMGDKTQAANFLLATRYPAAWVFAGAALAMGLVALATVFAGEQACRLASRGVLNKVSGSLLVLAGLAMLVS